MTTITEPYIEVFGCVLATMTEDGDWDHDHDSRLDCQWRFTCGTCGTEDLPCGQHAPLDVPGLMLTECSVPGAHPRTWVLASDGYGAPCMYCAWEAADEAHRGCAHSHHWPWRRWRVTGWLLHKGRMAGFITGGKWAMDSACRGCHSGFRIGRSGYLLGRPWWKWETLPRCLRRGHWPATADRCSLACDGREMNFCVKCSPCPGCEVCGRTAEAATADA